MQFPLYHAAHLENKAERFLRTKLGDDFSLPIDIEYLLESLEGVNFDYWPGLNANHGILGAVFHDKKTGQVCVYVDEQLADADHLRNRYRMTVAEELAHIVLHHEVIRKVLSVDDFRALHKHPDWYKAERDAKRFAAAVLMPGSWVLKEAGRVYKMLVDVAGFGDPESVKKYLRNQLAARFEVSPETMGYRPTEWPMKVCAKVDEAMDAQLDYLP
jgi:Zn-dependent peptidase ImmA (M78 family)